MQAISLFIVSLLAGQDFEHPEQCRLTGSHWLWFGTEGTLVFQPIEGADLVSVAAWTEDPATGRPVMVRRLVEADDARRLYARARTLGASKVDPYAKQRAA